MYKPLKIDIYIYILSSEVYTDKDDAPSTSSLKLIKISRNNTKIRSIGHFDANYVGKQQKCLL